MTLGNGRGAAAGRAWPTLIGGLDSLGSSRFKI
jgi:hypothetical protein